MRADRTRVGWSRNTFHALGASRWSSHIGVVVMLGLSGVISRCSNRGQPGGNDAVADRGEGAAFTDSFAQDTPDSGILVDTPVAVDTNIPRDQAVVDTAADRAMPDAAMDLAETDMAMDLLGSDVTNDQIGADSDARPDTAIDDTLNGRGCPAGLDLSSCGDVCPFGPFSTPVCIGGRCGLVCSSEHADCDGNPANGCEADLTTATTCGSCALNCPAGFVCGRRAGAATCNVGCPAGQVVCGAFGASCAVLASDPNHCGSCGIVCPAPLHGIATCTVGSCGIACYCGYAASGGACAG